MVIRLELGDFDPNSSLFFTINSLIYHKSVSQFTRVDFTSKLASNPIYMGVS
jgi:hypothetical protein